MEMIKTKTANAIRVLSADAIEKAKSGHPGLPLGCASIAYELWAEHMKHNPADPEWVDRDRFCIIRRPWLYAVVLSVPSVRIRRSLH